MEFGSEEAGGAVVPVLQALRLAVGLFAVAATGCTALLSYEPSTKYDNKIVRGEVSYVFSRQDMEENWKKKVSTLPDAPTLAVFLTAYRRVTVTVEKGLGSGFFVYPFVPDSMEIEVGAVVDVPLHIGGSLVGLFAGRPTIMRLVCASKDLMCRRSTEGMVRGSVGEVVPR
jgi:hypothetical protein